MVTKDYYCCKKGSAGNEKVKILLVYPKVGSEARNICLHLPLSVLCLAAYLKDFSVAIFDQRVDSPERFKMLLEQKPLCVGFSVMTGPQIKFSLGLADIVKSMGIPTVFGGVHPTILPEQTKEDRRVDYVVVGEGESALRSLVEDLLDNKKPQPIIKAEAVDLNRSPHLPYELIDAENYVRSAQIGGIGERALPVLFSRGCPFACAFCCNPVVSKRRWRAMDVDLLIEQLNCTVKNFNLDSVIFWDENMAVNHQLLNKLSAAINGRIKWYAQSRANSLLKYDLKYLEKMGLGRLSCGIESGSPRVLKKIKKEESVEEYIEANRRLAETDISIWYNYIVGFPGETIDDLKLTLKIALQIMQENPNADNNTFYLMVPYPGTEIGDLYLGSGYLPKNFEGWSDFGRYNFNVGWHPPEMLKLYKRICFSSKFTGRKISRIFPDHRGLKELSSKLTDKWRNFDFYDDKEWEALNNQGWQVLKSLFGENAY